MPHTMEACTHEQQLVPAPGGLDQENQGTPGHILQTDFGDTEAKGIFTPIHPTNIPPSLFCTTITAGAGREMEAPWEVGWRV